MTSIRQWDVGEVPFRLPKHFQVIRSLGQGAYGVVCEVQDERSQQHYAIKKCINIAQNVIVAKRALRELKLLRILIHSNIVHFEYVLIPGTVSKISLKI